MKRFKAECLIVIATIEHIWFKTKMERSLIGGVRATFKRKNSRFQIGDGPWEDGSSYDGLRKGILRRMRKEG